MYCLARWNILQRLPLKFEWTGDQIHLRTWWILVLFCGNPPFCSIAISLTLDFVDLSSLSLAKLEWWLYMLLAIPSCFASWGGLVNTTRLKVNICRFFCATFFFSLYRSLHYCEGSCRSGWNEHWTWTRLALPLSPTPPVKEYYLLILPALLGMHQTIEIFCDSPPCVSLCSCACWYCPLCPTLYVQVTWRWTTMRRKPASVTRGSPCNVPCTSSAMAIETKVRSWSLLGLCIAFFIAEPWSWSCGGFVCIVSEQTSMWVTVSL